MIHALRAQIILSLGLFCDDADSPWVTLRASEDPKSLRCISLLEPFRETSSQEKTSLKREFIFSFSLLRLSGG